MLDTVLFDLDGTLLNIDSDKFMEEYMVRLYKRVSNNFTFEEFNNHMKEAIMATIFSNDDSKTNEEVFKEKYKEVLGRDIDDIYNHISDFYDDDYTTITGMYSKSNYMIKSVNMLLNKGYKLVVATNPLFPLKALKTRVNWAGLNSEDFDFITPIEVMKFCKPNPRYYGQILDIIEKAPNQCMMVGNDVQEDMVAKTIDVNTYLVTNNIINRHDTVANADRISDSKGFYKFVKSLPKIPKS
ncbi:MAG: HAD family hydrolase [Clostridium sp.]|uniref:HAD family hydrolase n=1 Tax=Clostridium sp. TaxID=1506 RepID=UPI002FCB5A33